MHDSPSCHQDGPFNFKESAHRYDVDMRRFLLRKALLKAYLTANYTRDIDILDKIANDKNAQKNLSDMILFKEEDEKLKASFKVIVESAFIRFLLKQNNIVNGIKMKQVEYELKMLKETIFNMEERWIRQQEEKEGREYEIIVEVEKGEVVLLGVLRIIVMILFAAVVLVLVYDVKTIT